MPELPEVEHFKNVARWACAAGAIERAAVEPDELVFESPPEAIERALKGATIVDVVRHGKHLALVLDSGQRLHMRFGMTGALRTHDRAPLVLEGAKPDVSQWPPKFTKLHLRFGAVDGGRELVFTCTRRIARVSLEGPDTPFPPATLGFDALDGVPAEQLPRALEGRRGTIKGALLDQRVCAGLGNWLVDEVLREARIHPGSPVGSLEPDTITALAAAIERVLSIATKADARSGDFPEHWLFHVRWGRTTGPDETLATLDGSPVQQGRVAGRRTLWVPSELP